MRWLGATEGAAGAAAVGGASVPGPATMEPLAVLPQCGHLNALPASSIPAEHKTRSVEGVDAESEN